MVPQFCQDWSCRWQNGDATIRSVVRLPLEKKRILPPCGRGLCCRLLNECWPRRMNVAASKRNVPARKGEHCPRSNSCHNICHERHLQMSVFFRLTLVPWRNSKEQLSNFTLTYHLSYTDAHVAGGFCSQSRFLLEQMFSHKTELVSWQLKLT